MSPDVVPAPPRSAGRLAPGNAPAPRRLDVDAADPERLFARIAAGADYAYWLDSSSAGSGRGAPSRYSVLGVAAGPGARVLRYESAGRADPETAVLEPEAGQASKRPGSILEALTEELDAAPSAPGPGVPSVPGSGAVSAPGPDARPALGPDSPPAFVRRLAGAWVGYFGYELKADLGSPNRHESPTPDAVWMRASRCVVVDHATGEAWGLGDPAWLDDLERPDARPGADRTTAEGHPSAPPDAAFPAPDRTDYLQAVTESLAEIYDGNSYEVCLTAETSARLGVAFSFETAWGLYRAQRAANPAPHAAFLWCADLAVLSSSPERFLAVDEDGWCEAKPIKGTAPRSPDPALDAARAASLAADPKTRAENLMIVDLMRNDLSRVCDPATVQVPVLMGVESYATVHQLVSTVRGRLREGAAALDAVASCFPGGSMTGAPKDRTMQIIERLEDRARGVYSGAIGYLTPDGAADLSIVIRTTVLIPDDADDPRSRDAGAAGARDAARSRGSAAEPERGPAGTLARIAAGGAIVADSDPAEEYEEMLGKLRAPMPPGWRLA